jgi:sn-glycerol 3-phosphate transport system substrate-binding protein
MRVRCLMAGVTALTLMVAGCSSSNRADSPPLTDGPVVVTEAPPDVSVSVDSLPRGRCDSESAPARRLLVWHPLGGSEAPAEFDRQVAAFETQHPEIPLDVERIADGDLIGRLLTTPRDQWPDVLLSSPQTLRRLSDTQRVVLPEECAATAAKASELLPVVRAAFSIDGAMQAVPYGVSTPLLWFDAAKFRAAGLDPARPPKTLDELSQASAGLVDSGASPRGLVVYDWFFLFLSQTEGVRSGSLLLEPDNGRSVGTPKAVFDTPENRRIAQWIIDVTAEPHAVWIGGVPGGIEDLARLAVGDDRGAMTVHTSASLGDVFVQLDAGQFPDVELAAAPPPGLNASTEGMVGGNGFVIFDNGDASMAGAASVFSGWMTEPARIAQLASVTGYAPSSVRAAEDPGLLTAWKERPVLRVPYDVLRTMPDGAGAAGISVGPSDEMNQLFWQLTTRLVDDRLDPAAALQQFDRDVDRLLGEYAARQ